MRGRRALVALAPLLVATLACGGLARAQDDEPVADTGPDFEVHANHFVDAQGNTVTTGDRVALAEALQRALPGDVIELHTQVPTISIAQGNKNHRHVAIRSRPFEDITIRGGTPGAGISNINLGDAGGGIDQKFDGAEVHIIGGFG